MRCLRSMLLPVVLLATPLALLLSATGFAQGGHPELVTLPSLLELKRAGVGDDLLIMVIRKAKKVDFDTSPSGIVGLKNAGLTDAVIAAVMERQSGSTSTPPAPSTPPGPTFTVRQDGQPVALSAQAGKTTYVRSGANTADELYTSIKAGKPVPVRGRNPLKTVGLVLLEGENYEPRRSWKGFEIDYLSGRSSDLILHPATPIEFSVPFALLQTGNNPFAAKDLAPALLKLRVLPTEEIRIVSTRKVEYEPGRRKVLAVDKAEIEPAVERQATSFLVRVTSLDPGEYTLAFRNIRLSYFDVANSLLPFRVEAKPK